MSGTSGESWTCLFRGHWQNFQLEKNPEQQDQSASTNHLVKWPVTIYIRKPKDLCVLSCPLSLQKKSLSERMLLGKSKTSSLSAAFFLLSIYVACKTTQTSLVSRSCEAPLSSRRTRGTYAVHCHAVLVLLLGKCWKERLEMYSETCVGSLCWGLSVFPPNSLKRRVPLGCELLTD